MLYTLAQEIQYRVRHFEAGEEEISESAGASETAFPPNSADGSDKCPGKAVQQL